MDKLYVSDIDDLLNEWNYKKNNELNLYPNAVTHGSVKKVWWKCKEGHEWQATPNNRERGIGCPYCYGRYPVKGVNDLATTHPALINEWNYEKNGMLVPEMFKGQSNKKVWWVCGNCEHEWQAYISNRAKGVGCPKCSSKRNGERKMVPSTCADSLYEKQPELIAEWNYDKNKTISPMQIKPRSNKKVWWKCKEGHEWEATPNSRYEGCGCPYCSKQKVLVCFNDLLTINPELAKEWNYERNGELRPENVSAGSNQKVWWVCKKGHEWEAVVSYRNNGTGCPYCSNQKVLKGYNDLLTINPEVAKEWNYERNGDLTPEKIVAGSGKRVWWKCEKGHEWQALISSRNKNHKCPECLSGLRTSLPEQAIYYYISKVFKDAINTYKPEGFNGKEIDIYIPSINLGIEYDGVAWHKKSERDLEKNKLARQNKIDLIRIREKGCPILGDEVHCIETDKYDFDLLFIEQPIKLLLEYIERKYGVPCYCDIDVIRDYDTIFESLNISSKENSIEITHPALMQEWDYEKNGSSLPNMFVAGSEKKVWWICQKNHHYQASVYSRSKGSGCPYCAGRSVLRGYNDLQTVNPELAKEWNYEKNGELTPENVVVGSVKKVWWKCKEGHEWQASLNARSRTGCPCCANRIIVKGYNDLATTNALLLEEWDFEKNNVEGISPYSISNGSGKKVYWLCKKGHSYSQAICSRSKGVGCPYCAGKKVLQGYNDLTTTKPQLAMEWNYEKNGELTPEKISAGSGKKVWWKCKEGHEWSAFVSNRSKGVGCPICSGRYANQ